jgi:hypothetical protein
VSGLKVTPFALPDGCVASYYPECNPLVPLSHHDQQSKTPAAKAVPVCIDRESTTAHRRTNGRAEAATGINDGRFRAHRCPRQTKLQGKDFTKEYDDMQVSAHKDAVPLFERYGRDGDNPDLKAFAGKTLPTLKKYLQMAQELGK